MLDTTFIAGTTITKEWLNEAQSTINNITYVSSFGAVGDGVTDDIAAIEAAMAALPVTGGNVMLMGKHAISRRINVTKPVTFIGLVTGSGFQPVQAGRTEFVWIGGVDSGAMLRIGLFGTGTNVLWGGGLKSIRFNGGGVVAHGLEIADASWGTYEDVYVYNVTVSGLHGITDGTKTGMPSAWNRFYNCFFDMRTALAASANAHGILIEAVNGNNAGVTLWYFEGLKVNHSGGDGCRWVTGGDGFVFMKPQMFRADSETGISFNFTNTSPTDICNHCIFYYPIATSGFNFQTAGLHIGTIINDFDSQNINSGISTLVRGAGASEVAGNMSFGQTLGLSRLGSVLDTLIDDPMSFVRFDTTNNVCLTTSGNWTIATASSTACTAASGGTGVRLSTIATAGNSTLLSHTSAPVGTTTARWPSLQAGLSLDQTTNLKVRLGFFDSNADPAGDGIWVEYDPTLSSGAYRLVCSRGLSQTVVVNSSGLTGTGNPILRWRIDVQPGRASFYLASPGAPNPQLWSFVGTITTNVPITSTRLGAGALVVTTAAAIATTIVSDIKLAQKVNFP